MDKYLARHQKFMTRLASARLAELTVLVGAEPPGGSRSQGEGHWNLHVDCCAYRVDGGPVRREPLKLVRYTNYTRLRQYMDSVGAFNILRIKARMPTRKRDGIQNALLVKTLRRNALDAELQHLATELRKPVRYRHPDFGTFTLDRRSSIYTTQTRWNRSRIRLELSVDTPENIAPSLETAQGLWKDQSTWHARALEFAVEDILRIVTEGWDSEEPRPTREAILEHLTLESIGITAPGRIAFCFDDGDLLGGHAAYVTGTLAGGFEDMDLIG